MDSVDDGSPRVFPFYNETSYRRTGTLVAKSASTLLLLFGDFWWAKLLNNLFGYSLVLFPCFLTVCLVKRYCDTLADSCPKSQWKRCISVFTFGSQRYLPTTSLSSVVLASDPQRGLTSLWCWSNKEVVNATKLVFCAVGLQLSYLTWGVLQEKLMTRNYLVLDASVDEETRETSGVVPARKDRFTDSQFLVFANRFVAMAISSVLICCRPAEERLAPFYKFSYASISNILSSWCQYEALKFITFPTQVVCKASKVLPVMVMGRFIQRRTYSARQYFSAVLITVGLAMFMLSTDRSAKAATTSRMTTFSGLVLMVGYLTFDSFTSNWQSSMFETYHISTVQMMFGVNVFSCMLTLVSLLQQNGLSTSLAFLKNHKGFGFDVLVTSVASAVGQLFIFYTVSEFGPVTFTIIMAVRQALSILLSCLIYDHRISILGLLGIFVVFCAVFLRIYWRKSISSFRRVSCDVVLPLSTQKS